MNRREFCRNAAMAAAGLALPKWILSQCEAADTPASAAKPSSRPNIIFILADDLGLGDLACTGSDKFKTPNIDELAKNGLRFEHCYATPLCGPSRCMLMTGRYPFRTGMTHNRTDGPDVMNPKTMVMFPQLLKQAGYVTAACGKWYHLSLRPSDWGCDEYLMFGGGGGVYWPKDDKDNSSYEVNGKTIKFTKGYMPDLMHDWVVDFMTRHKDKGDPFFIYYSLSHIHSQVQPTPDSAAGSDDKVLYGDMVAYMDKLMGKLMTELDNLKLRQNTLIVFAGDNGTWSRYANYSTIDGKRLSGAKTTLSEGGCRVPLIINWPSVTPVGKVSKDLTDFSDFLPTMVEVAGAKMPEGVKIDGQSLVLQIKGQPGKPRKWVYSELDGQCYVRNDRWKLTGRGELFDMKEAPFQEIPVPADTNDPQAQAARKALHDVLTNELKGCQVGEKTG